VRWKTFRRWLIPAYPDTIKSTVLCYPKVRLCNMQAIAKAADLKGGWFSYPVRAPVSGGMF